MNVDLAWISGIRRAR
jgi:hypothetical protein